MNFFSFNFALREFFFVLRPPPDKFSNGPSNVPCIYREFVKMDWALTMIGEDLFVTLLGPKLGPDVFTCDESGVCSS